MIRSASLLLVLAACAAPPAATDATPVVVSLPQIEADADGRCFARTDPPVRVDVVERTEEVMPPRRDAEGRITAPAVVRRVSVPQEVVTGTGARFEVVCPRVLTETYVASLQRALLVRQTYAGPISGTYDSGTRAAVRAAQQELGIGSEVLSVSLARRLGLTAVARD